MNRQREMSVDGSANTVRFCLTCNKPFTAGSSFTRHVSYCRRAQSRPKFRRKPCRACKIAKVKCCFLPRCARCTSKGLDCVYEGTSAMEGANPTSNYETPSDSATELWNHDQTSMPIDFNTPETFALDLLDFEPIQELPFVAPSYDAELMSVGKKVGPMSFLDGVSLLPTSWDFPLDSPMSSLATRDHGNIENHGYLTKVSLSSAFAQHSADLIMEALYAIPEQMRRRETFPPFIHPHWHLSALPEPLAICMQIAGMYSLRAPELEGFIWRSILAEQRRAVERLDMLSKQELHAEIQAGVVYLMMRLVDGVMQDLEWTREMMVLQTALCTRFLENNDFCYCNSEQTHPSLTWEDWIYAESRRRTSLIWFLITRTIVVKTVKWKDNCPTADAPQTLPLPAPKSQWEARTRETWAKELEAEGPAMKTFGNLIEAKQHAGERESMQMLGAWNASTDNLGSLLNIAVAMV